MQKPHLNLNYSFSRNNEVLRFSEKTITSNLYQKTISHNHSAPEPGGAAPSLPRGEVSRTPGLGRELQLTGLTGHI